ncbi:RES domain-containing protein [Sinimarinibacterium sp. CAU 1509]|uniref:RES family NAD+ phosphorylase n=1 Tax=Sinimarinibacterium sp. CAU 1509 TaxID=2562283 RepID=UPI0010ABD8E1|nr:RES family NAD+ phosphorylase [Sinimarinibacterium sp. CAU 1509]TJY57415.1 RES domain-containing protein [Sinimarinibacterium sp. CAU 1509]
MRVIAPPFATAYRIIPSRFPPVGVFDDLASAAELELLFMIEARTNERLREDIGALSLVDPEDWLTGPGATAIMAAFTHPAPGGSRFSDGSYGVYYCADSSEVAIRETAYHRARFLRTTGEGVTRIEMRQYAGTLAKPLHDGRGRRLEPGALAPDDYSASQRIGASLRAQRSWGLVYPSVRMPGGLCAALLRPPAITGVIQSASFQYVFDGESVTEVYPVGDAIRLG